MHVQRTLLLFAATLWLPSVLPAQYPALAPTSNTVISTSGPLHYSSILIPAGVTVRFTGTAPAVVSCDGDCIVHGTLSAAGLFTTDGPGAVTLGTGGPGYFCQTICSSFGCACGGSTPAGSGVHHGAYGSSLPFSLEGGSPGGFTADYDNSTPLSCCDIFLGFFWGGGGGGTLALLAEGRIEVDGTVDVSGGQTSFAAGSAGSLLLRGAAGTRLLPGGRLLAGPASANGGYVRLDAWGNPPFVQGSIIAPSPTLLELPHLRASSPPTVGTTWLVDVFAPANTLVILAVSLQAGASTPTPFGTLVLDLPNAATVASVVSPAGSHDPQATIQWPIPNNPNLLGLSFYLQGIAVPAALSPRLTNAIFATVQ